MFRQIIYIITLVCTLLSFTPTIYAADQPLYAKWGKIAMNETKNKYHAAIVDYLHMGRTQINENITEEKFKLWLRKANQQEFGVYITIRFDTHTEQILFIHFEETAH
ncbi:DUF3889 domain-containing protein [Paenibacillus albiflavus]|uniref:DUF3889 domain-containing protein n=2 Tax=Paenibacillus albiflavus TaxID=2545760 RepID=A0A4R4ELX5_9BACL|nr:DUF3889 domain-containing protein [Paenibacillus albiflavus]